MLRYAAPGQHEMDAQHLDAEVVASIKDPRVVAARKGLEDRSLYLVEGTRMLRQAVAHGAAVQSVFFLDPLGGEARGLYEAARRALPVCRASRGVFFKVLGLGYETATDALGLVRVPAHDARLLLERVPCTRDTCYLVGQGIQDPRNVGVLVRTADAFSASAFMLSADSAFPWSRQSIRSTTGSIFRVPVYLATDLEGLVDGLKARGISLIGTSASGAVDCEAAAYRYPCAVLLGNESTGISERLRVASDMVVRIPMTGGAHSLNVTVAGGILLHEVSRRRPPPAAPLQG